MGEVNEGEEKENDTSEEEFEFYFSFTKPLVLDLPTEEDRALAAAWVQKLEAEPKTKKEREERLNYLKLLLFVLQRGRLSGIFARQPPSGPLQPFPQGFSVLDMGNLMLELDDDQLYGGGDARRIPYVMELSDDLREYIASQEVPNFGVQMYYAWSSEEPVHKWSLFDEEKFPQYILEKIKQMKAAKYDEKSRPSTETCETDKKGCNFPFPDILSTKKVKSPEEIEKSQGRSFLTYMGLAGRAGNFNDKCDEDLERLQKQNLSRKCSSKRKKCPGNGGAEETTGDEDFDNFVSGLGGELSSINRPCLCPNPAHQTNCPVQQMKKRPQSACVENQVMRNSDCENAQWSSQAPKSVGAGRMREQCFENNPSGITPQRNVSPRNTSLNRHGLECPLEGNSGGFPNQGEICVCTSPPCTCPCPRAPPKSPPQKTASPGNGGRVCQSSNRIYSRPARQDAVDCNVNRNRGIGTHLMSFNAPEPCTPATPRPDITPTGGRTCGESANLRPVLHCYNNQNPDPALTRTIEKNDNWMPLEGGGAKFVDTEYKTATVRDQLIAKAMENKCTLSSRRGLFNSQPQPGPSGMSRTRPQNEYPAPSCTSPPLAAHPLCDYSGSTEEDVFPWQQCPQNFADFQGGAPQMHSSCGGRVNTSTQKKTQSQSACRPKNTNQAPGPFAVTNDSGRLANMSNVLRGMKQKTEAYREKCTEPGVPRTHTNENYCIGGVQGQIQTKFPKQSEQRIRGAGGFVGGANEQMSRNMMSGCTGYQAPPPTPQLPCSSLPNTGFGNFYNSHPNRNLGSPQFPSETYDFTLYKLPPYPQGECDPCYEEEDEDDDECESSESVEEPCQNKSEDRSITLSEQCKEALDRRRQDYYTLNWEESDFESQECRDGKQYPNLSSTPVEFMGTMLSANDTSCEPQWASPRRVPMKNPSTSTRTFADICVNNDERNAGSPRTNSGGASQRISPMNELQADNSTAFDETCNRTSAPQGSRNRYFERSMLARGQDACPRPNHQPICSTPLRQPRETFKDLGVEDISRINH